MPPPKKMFRVNMIQKLTPAAITTIGVPSNGLKM
jgi:hypothetical protein